MSTQTPAGVAASYFDALSSGNVPAAMDLFSPDVVWHQPGKNRFSGDHSGVGGVGELLGGMMEVSAGTFKLEVTGPSMTNGDMVAVPVRFSGNRSGQSMNMAGIDLLTVNEGKITEVHLFSEDGAGEDLFWGQV